MAGDAKGGNGDLEALRARLKQWEDNFMAKHGKKPEAADVRAHSAVADDYRDAPLPSEPAVAASPSPEAALSGGAEVVAPSVFAFSNEAQRAPLHAAPQTESGQKSAVVDQAQRPKARKSAKKRPLTVSTNFRRLNLKRKFRQYRKPGLQRGGRSRIYRRRYLSRAEYAKKQAAIRGDAMYAELLSGGELELLALANEDDVETASRGPEAEDSGDLEPDGNKAGEDIELMKGAEHWEDDDNGISDADDDAVEAGDRGGEPGDEEEHCAAHVSAPLEAGVERSPKRRRLQIAPAAEGELRHVLRDAFGHRDFRPGQLEIVSRVLRGESVLGVLPTSGGKSLCYQLPALLLPGLTLVVSPLLSLMDDQLVRLPPGLRGVAWNSFQSATQAHEIMRRLRSGDVKVLFVSPERVLSSGFQRFLLSLDGGVSLACVDEAHCVSEWSHNFRPSFLGLGRVLCDVLRVPLVLALTATATLDTAASVCRVLRIPLANIVRNAPLRDNLRTHVERVVEPEARRRRLLELLQRDELRGKPALVYVLRRKDADETAFWLRERGLNADSYHSGKTTRRQVQQRFLTGAVSVLVATVAFGMGIDKPDIRGVFHLSLPRSLEEYVQQVGRAGRDGAEAWCTAFFGEEDVTLLKSLLHAEVVERPVAKKLFSALLLGQDGAKEDGACGHNNRTRFTTFLLADAQAEFGLSPEVALTLVCNLPRTARGTQIEFVGRQHAHALVRFHKTHPEELARSVPIVAGVLQTAQCSAGGSYKVNLATVANAVGCDVSDAQASLLRLKATREVSLEWRDQALIFEKSSGSVELDVDELTDAALGRIAAYQQLQSLKVDIVHAAFACAAAGAAHEQQKDRDEPGPRGVLAAVCDEYFASALETSGRHFLLELRSRAGSSAQLRDWRCDPRSKHLQSEIASLVRQHEYQVSPTWVAKFMHGLLHDAARAEAGRHASFGRYAFVPFEELQSLARQVIQCVLADN